MYVREVSHKYRIFFKFVSSYMLLLIVSASIGIFTYMETIKMVEDDVKKSNLAMLEQSRDIIDRYLDEIEIVTKRLALNPKVNSLLNMGRLEEGSPDIYKTLDAWNDLSSYRITNSFIKELYI